MKFTFKKFGYIDEGNVELADLTLICGPNNVGKTYISYAIYGFLKHFQHLVNLHLERKQVDELRNMGSIQVDLSLFLERIADCFENAGTQFSKQLGDFFNAPDEFFKNARTDFAFPDFNPDFAASFKGVINFGKQEAMRFDKAEDSNILNIVLQIKENSRLPVNLLQDIISERIAWCLFSRALPKPFAITSERTGIALFYKELDINKYAILEQLSELEQKKDFDPFKLMNSMRSRYAEPIKDNIDIIRDYELLSKKKSFLRGDKASYKSIFDVLQSMTGGGFKTVNGQVFYRPKKERGRSEILVPVYLSSSSIKSLFLIDFYLSCLAEEGGLLIIDEPELNLHPDNQRKMAGLIARLVNGGVKVMVTTHSDYLVREINNRIMLSNTISNKEELMQSKGLLEEDILKPEQVAAYALGANHTINHIRVDRFGIDLAIFDELIADANRTADDIYYSIKE